MAKQPRQELLTHPPPPDISNRCVGLYDNQSAFTTCARIVWSNMHRRYRGMLTPLTRSATTGAAVLHPTASALDSWFDSKPHGRAATRHRSRFKV